MTDDLHARFHEHVVPELEIMYRVAMRLTRDPNEAEDLVQDALVRAFRALDRFDGRYPRAWLLTILRNTHLNRIRKRRPDLLDDEVGREVPARGPDGRQDGVADQAFQDRFDPLVREALRRLSCDQRACIALVDLDGLSYQEAADLLGVPIGTVMSRLHRARRKIRTHLERHGVPEIPR